MTTGQNESRLVLFPPAAEVSEKGHLVIGGCDTVALAEEFGTPLYIFDEQALRQKCAEFRNEFGKRYPDTAIVYAGKAFVNRALAVILKEEGLGLDVVSGGELSIARSVDFPMEKIYFHGNNKSAGELDMALESKIGRIVIDNFQELEMLAGMAGQRGATPDVLLRLTPGVDPHTHRHISTGVEDSKFGIPLASADEAVNRAMSAPGLNLIGLQFHLGSQIFEVEPYREAVRVIMDLAAEMKMIVDPDLVHFAELDGEPVGICLGLPDVYQAMLKAKPQPNTWSLPLTLGKFLWHRRKMDTFRLWAMGVLPEYRALGIDAIFYVETARKSFAKGYLHCEMSWILESNTMMNRIIERLGGVIYKTYRIYEKPLNGG